MTFMKKQAGLLFVLCLLLTLGATKAQAQITTQFSNSVIYSGSPGYYYPALYASASSGPPSNPSADIPLGTSVYNNDSSYIVLDFYNWSGQPSDYSPGVGGNIEVLVYDSNSNIVYDETQYIAPYAYWYPGSSIITGPGHVIFDDVPAGDQMFITVTN